MDIRYSTLDEKNLLEINGQEIPNVLGFNLIASSGEIEIRIKFQSSVNAIELSSSP